MNPKLTLVDSAGPQSTKDLTQMVEQYPKAELPDKVVTVETEQFTETVKAHLAICEMLECHVLSEQTRRQLGNLQKLLELEISAMKSQQATLPESPIEGHDQPAL